MKVLHVINHLSSGGAERLVSDLTQKMNNDCFDVEILTLSDKRDVYSAELKSRGFVVFTLSNVSI